MKERIANGFTNISYRDNDKFIQEQVFTGFNHALDYSLLKVFSWVPELIKVEKGVVTWRFIEGQQPEINDQNLITIANHLKELHNSKLKFPASNHGARVKKYRQVLKEKNVTVPVLEEFYRQVNMTIGKMKKDTPLHNDLWPWNMVETKDHRIYIVDWEYATMGDKHFDLAYFILACRLNERQEELFLKTYGEYDYLYLLRQKIFVEYLVVLWANAQEKMPFDTQEYIDKIYEFNKELQKIKR